jgi:hypothetical protein
MRLKYSSISTPASIINEDHLGIHGERAWVLDGATSISGRRSAAEDGREETDAAWFVRRFSVELARMSNTSLLLDDIQGILDRIRGDGHRKWGAWIDHDIPSASFLHVCIRPGRVEAFNLGDCLLLYEADAGSLESFGASAVRALDGALLDAYRALRSALPDLSHADAWNQLVPLIRSNRKLMNTQQGYWILEPRGEGLRYGQRAAISYRHSFRGLLVTDGLYRLVDTYRLYTREHFFDAARRPEGLKRLAHELRVFEKADPDCRMIARVKARDDATGVWIEAIR